MPKYRMTRNRYGNVYSPYKRSSLYSGYAAAAGAAGLAATAGRWMSQRQTLTRGLRGRGVRSGQGVSTQHDRRTVYRKKSMPRRRKRSWKRFSRKVNAVSEKTLGSKTIVFNDQVNLLGTLGSTDQISGNVALYPMNHSSAYLDDINRIQNNANTEYGVTTKYIFQSGIFDMTLVNISFDATTALIPVELDIYEITSSSTWQEGPTSLIGALQQGFTDTTNEGVAATGLALTQRGVTPFDCPQGLGSYRIKIWKKTKYFLGGGQWLTYQMRDPKRHVLDAKNMLDWDSANKPGITRWLLIIGKTLPNANLGLTGACSVQIGVTRKYFYKINSDSTDQDGFNV